MQTRYRKGDEVRVFKYGRWYNGKVTDTGRTLVTVRFQQVSGREVERKFHFTSADLKFRWSA